MRSLANLIALSLTIAAATALAGWWTAPVVAALWTLAMPRPASVIYAAVAGALAWAVMLFASSHGGAVGAMDHLLAQIMNVPERMLIGLTILYCALLTGSAALVAQGIRPPLVRTRSKRSGS